MPHHTNLLDGYLVEIKYTTHILLCILDERTYTNRRSYKLLQIVHDIFLSFQCDLNIIHYELVWLHERRCAKVCCGCFLDVSLLISHIVHVLHVRR